MSKAGTSRAAAEERRARFVVEFLKDLNATQAAIRAGYSERAARQQGSRLLTDAAIQTAITKANAERVATVAVDATTVLRELLHLATSDLGAAFDDAGNLLPIHEMPETVRRALAGVEVDELWDWEGEGDVRTRTQVGVTKKVKLWDKPRALELLAKHLNLFADHQKEKSASFAQLVAEAFGGGRARG